jgi:hypothetical protein
MNDTTNESMTVIVEWSVNEEHHYDYMYIWNIHGFNFYILSSKIASIYVSYVRVFTYQSLSIILFIYIYQISKSINDNVICVPLS